MMSNAGFNTLMYYQDIGNSVDYFTNIAGIRPTIYASEVAIPPIKSALYR